MAVADELYPPVGYSPTWMVLGWLAIVAAGAVVAWAFWPARKPPAVTTSAVVEPLHSVKERYLGIVDALTAAYRNGDVNHRTLHHGLSEAVRGFLAETEGLPADAMTPADLARAGLTEAAQTVWSYWDPQFRLRSHGDADRSIMAARDVIERWRATRQVDLADQLGAGSR